MQEEKLNSWEQFEEQLKILKEEYPQLNNSIKTYPEHFLFRGVAKSKRKLETTLERTCNGENMSLTHFNQLLKKQIAKFKKQNNNCALCKRSCSWITCINLPTLSNIPGYNCMACLRQNGFPSPLLDWSQSPNIAAYFAFYKASDNQIEEVSVYVFLETYGTGKLSSSDEPRILSLGHTIETDPKHEKQRGEYTICVVQDGGEWYFASHENVFIRNEKEQDCLWKFNIPVTERQNVLKILETRNVNANTLGFDS